MVMLLERFLFPIFEQLAEASVHKLIYPTSDFENSTVTNSS